MFERAGDDLELDGDCAAVFEFQIVENTPHSMSAHLIWPGTEPSDDNEVYSQISIGAKIDYDSISLPETTFERIKTVINNS